jgi:hypothetical protein
MAEKKKPLGSERRRSREATIYVEHPVKQGLATTSTPLLLPENSRKVKKYLACLNFFAGALSRQKKTIFMNTVWLYFLKMFEQMLATEEPAVQAEVAAFIHAVFQKINPALSVAPPAPVTGNVPGPAAGVSQK